MPKAELLDGCGEQVPTPQDNLCCFTDSGTVEGESVALRCGETNGERSAVGIADLISKIEKKPRVPTELMVMIFGRLRTSELVRFISPSVPVLRSYWSAGLKTVIERRLPFSVRPSNSARMPLIHYIVVDRAGATVATIKHPELFSDSQICHLIEEAVIVSRVLHLEASDVENWRTAKTLFLPLANLTSICLNLKEKAFSYPNRFVNHPSITSDFNDNFREHIPQLESFQLVEKGLPNCEKIEMAISVIRQMTSLRSLSVKAEIINLLIPDVIPYAPRYQTEYASEILSHLKKLNVVAEGNTKTKFVRNFALCYFAGECLSLESMHFIRTCCFGLVELSLTILGPEIDISLFRALTGLKTLGLQILKHRLVENVSANEQAVLSVTDLRLGLNNEQEDGCRWIMSLLAKFPNVKSLAVQFSKPVHWRLEMLAFICERQVLPQLKTLRAITEDGFGGVGVGDLTRFLRGPNMPRVLDLAQFAYFLFTDSRDLVDLYEYMRCNNITQCNTRGAVTLGQFNKMQNYLSQHGNGTGRIFRWLRYESDIELEQHCIRICGVKTGGDAKGEAFVFDIGDVYSTETVGLFE